MTQYRLTTGAPQHKIGQARHYLPRLVQQGEINLLTVGRRCRGVGVLLHITPEPRLPLIGVKLQCFERKGEIGIDSGRHERACYP